MYNNKKVLVWGMGISGKSAYQYLKNKNADVFIYDDYIKNGQENELLRINKRTLKQFSLIVISPSVKLSNNIRHFLKHKKIPVVPEIELGLKNKEYIAVTGTDGKTTTVKLITHIFNECSINSISAGNIGVPVTSVANDQKQLIVEVSSFMLMQTSFLKPHYAILTNIAPDHLNIHKNFASYIKLKMSLFKNLTSTDYAIVNYDNLICRNKLPKIYANTYYFSIKESIKGCYLHKKSIYFNNGIKTIKVMNIKNIQLIGEHNLQNILASICVAMLNNLPIKQIEQAVNSFKGLPHRLEFVKEINTIKFFNDSKATTVQATISAISSFKKDIILIAGGSDKKTNYKPLANKIVLSGVSKVILIGSSAQKITKELLRVKYNNFVIVNSLKEATNLAFLSAKQNGIVLLSPASASFDMFKSYEERGKAFKEAVESINFEKN